MSFLKSGGCTGKNKNLLPGIYPIVDDYMKGVIKQYSEMDQKKEDGIPS